MYNIFVKTQYFTEAHICETLHPDSWQENQKIWKSVTSFGKPVGSQWLMDRSGQKSYKDGRENVTDQEDSCG